MRAQGKVAVVTGGASGLGRACAQALADAGATVVVADLPSSAGEQFAEELGGGARFVATDVVDEDQVAFACDTARELGDFRIAVHCAGIGTPGRLISRGEPLSLDSIRKVLDINLLGTFNILRLAAHRMLPSEIEDGERGVIICTASVAAFEGQVGQAAYAASKGGVCALTLCAARDFADKAIRVVTIAPGTFETPMRAGASDEVRASLAAQVPHPSRLGRPEEFADLALAVVNNPMINGETIRLDGAIRMAPR
jgi:NAD(P)-dependent dehydrogenase (short-subunit alcohol dehydrogenase family)